jgi:hypothetical protein
VSAESAPGASGSVRAGHFAKSELLLPERGAAGGCFELELVSPFGALFSALFPTRPFRLHSLSFDYVAPLEQSSSATFSVKVAELGAGDGAAQLSLLVFRESLVCVRGSARLEFSPSGGTWQK